MNTTSFYKTKLSELHGKKQVITDSLTTTKNTLSTLQQSLIYLEKAQVIIRKVAKDIQDQLKYRVADVVNLALSAVFPDKYQFDVQFDVERGRTVANLVFTDGGCQIDPMSASGGGVVDIAAFALRIAVFSLGKTDNVIILDEPMKKLQPKELHIKGMEIIKEISKRLHIQFIINANSVSNEDLIDIADKVFTVKQKDKIDEWYVSTVEEK